MRLEAAITGNLTQYMKQEVAAAEAAVTAGVKEVTTGVQTDLRQQVSSSGLGQGLANSWRAKFYPSGKSIKAAGYIYTKAPDIIYAFNYGVTIRSSKGFFLAVPTTAAPKRGTDGKRINPTNFPEGSYGKLRFVYRPGKISLLVIDDLRASTGKRGGFRRASDSAIAKGRGITTVVMFFLVPQVSLKKKLDVDAAVDKWDGLLGDRILGNWQDVKD
jgi:hypothetical protein